MLSLVVWIKDAASRGLLIVLIMDFGCNEMQCSAMNPAGWIYILDRASWTCLPLAHSMVCIGRSVKMSWRWKSTWNWYIVVPFLIQITGRYLQILRSPDQLHSLQLQLRTVSDRQKTTSLSDYHFFDFLSECLVRNWGWQNLTILSTLGHLC